MWSLMVSRPKPSILKEWVDNKTFRSEQVLASRAIYAVFHQGQPINLKSSNIANPNDSAKYKKSAFSNPGHAVRLAEKLNKMFKTQDFEVYVLTQGQLYDHDQS